MRENLPFIVQHADIIMHLAKLSEITVLLGDDKKLTITPENHKKIVKELKGDDIQTA